MGSNVIRLSRPVIHPEVREVRKVIQMPNLFTIILNTYKKKQDEIKQRKIKILTDAAYKYFLGLLKNEKLLSPNPALNSIDLPEFIYRERRKKLAREKASEAMMDVIKNNRVDECFKAYKKYLKQQNRG